ncbi:MAG: glycoside hydrolase family 10 protein, partial [Bacillota bacterium]
MRTVFLLIILLCLFPGNSFSQPLEELRGVWITNVDSDLMTSDGQKIADAMDYLSSIGINVIFPVMWNNGYTLYPSRIMDENFSRRISPKIKPGLDPLERLIIEAHRNGIEVIPWMEYGFASSYSTGIINDPIINKFPNWATKTSNGNICTDGKENTGFVWMSGINPEVQNFIISLVTEIADNYDIDGIQGDDRLPAMPVEGGYDSTTIAVYRSEHNGNLPPLDFK